MESSLLGPMFTKQHGPTPNLPEKQSELMVQPTSVLLVQETRGFISLHKVIARKFSF